MLWVTGLDDRFVNAEQRNNLQETAKAAVRSVRANTTLDAAFLYAGDDEGFKSFLHEQDVRCISHVFSHTDVSDLASMAPPSKRAFYSGAWLRADIPLLFAEEEEYVLYTDTDVIFRRDVATLLLQHPKPELLSAVYWNAKKYGLADHFNSGVLLMNVQNMLKERDGLFEFAGKIGWGLQPYLGADEYTFNHHFIDRVTPLSRTFNWCPSWGIYEHAPIVHYQWSQAERFNEYLERGLEHLSKDTIPPWWWLDDATVHDTFPNSVHITKELAQYYRDLYTTYGSLPALGPARTAKVVAEPTPEVEEPVRDIPMDLWPMTKQALLFEQDVIARYETSRSWCGYLKKYVELDASSDVLEIGFGAGRTARILWDYISPAGSYCGLEVHEDMVDWHSHNITPLRPNVRFFHADVTNAAYGRAAEGSSPAKYVFPFADESFDVVFLASVFTHMFPADIANYLQEIRRVLRPGGCVLASCFLIDAEVKGRMEEGLAQFHFTLIPGHLQTWSAHSSVFEACMGYSDAAHYKLYEDAKLDIIHSFTGNWSGGDPEQVSTFTGQDIVVARRPAVSD